MVEVPGVSGGSPGDQHEDQCERSPHPGRGALAGAPFRGGVGGAVAPVFLLGSLGLAPPAAAGSGRLVDLAPELVEALLDRVLGRVLRRVRLRRHLSSIC